LISWAVQQVGDAYYVVLHCADCFYRWVIESVATVGKVLGCIFDKVLRVAAKVMDWLGYLFNWADIRATHVSIVHFLNSAADAAANKLSGLADTVEDICDKVEDGLKKMTPLSDDTTSLSTQSTSDEDKGQSQSVFGTAPANNTFYYVSYGCSILLLVPANSSMLVYPRGSWYFERDTGQDHQGHVSCSRYN